MKYFITQTIQNIFIIVLIVLTKNYIKDESFHVFNKLLDLEHILLILFFSTARAGYYMYKKKQSESKNN